MNATEIDLRLKHRYLERLAERIKRMRQQVLRREWKDLRMECHQLRGSGESYGFPELTKAATQALNTLPKEDGSGAPAKPSISADARQSVEELFTTIDHVLTTHAITRI